MVDIKILVKVRRKAIPLKDLLESSVKTPSFLPLRLSEAFHLKISHYPIPIVLHRTRNRGYPGTQLFGSAKAVAVAFVSLNESRVAPAPSNGSR